MNRVRVSLHRHGQAGLTLVELMVTLALLGVMAMMCVPMAEVASQRAREHELRDALREIRAAIDRYKAAADQGLIERKVGDNGYPPDLEVLVRGVTNQRSPQHETMRFLRRVPRDPFAPATGDAADTWGLRSYASPPEAPVAGSDVFDVYSRAPGHGLNGLPYREW